MGAPDTALPFGYRAQGAHIDVRSAGLVKTSPGAPLPDVDRETVIYNIGQMDLAPAEAGRDMRAWVSAAATPRGGW